MKFKFGDHVTVVRKGFYEAARGTVVAFDSVDGQYEVLFLAQPVRRSFYAVDLRKQHAKKVGSRI